MKKLVLLFILFSFSIVTAQFTQPSQFNSMCDDDNDGFTFFYLGEITAEIIGNLNYQNYTITHHETQTDAQIGANALPPTYFNTNPFTQVLYARIVTIATGQVDIFPYTLYALPPTQGATYTLTNCATGTSCWDLNSMGSQVSQGQSGSSVTYFVSQSDALSNTNPIIEVSCYVLPLGIPDTQVYYRVDHLFSSECPTIGPIQLVTIDCTPCNPPTALIASNVTANSAVISWNPNSEALSWQINLVKNGDFVGTYQASTNPFTLTELDCNSEYSFSIFSFCNGSTSQSAGPYFFMTMACPPQSGQPTDLQICSDSQSGIGCFDLSANTPLIMNTLNPSEYTVTYYTSQANANAGVAAIFPLNNYCASSGTVVYARLENNTTQAYQIMSFSLSVNTYFNDVITLAGMDQCDDNSDSVVIYNLTNIQTQINSGNSLAYYGSLANAQNQTSPIANPAAFSVGVQTPTTTIFVREIVPNGCDVFYTFLLQTYSLCNLASTCSMANSLCQALGVPFANTHQAALAQPGNYYGCLSTQPNPTWFYLPVSENGTINLKIEQNSSANFNANQLDVDYIVYGPYTNPVTPCSGQLTQANMVSCSYSANAVEYPIIANAQVGQFYIIMVTNYSNQAGYIRITEMSTTVGAINCNGLRLNAFLDANNNGNQDNGEQNFPLGQFTYEVNNNGNVHNITSPSGVYNIYDPNVANSYHLTYAIDSNYTSEYSLSTAAYANVNAGSGMTVYNFPVTIVQSYFDLAVNITPLSAPRPGFTYQNIISYTNNGNQTIASGTLTFNKDALVTITNTTQSGTVPTASGFTYNFTNLLPFETRSMTVTMQVPTLPTVAINGLLTNTASITPTSGDVVLGNNTSGNTQIIIGAYDPNDKMESHGEKIVHASFTSGDYLYYTIRFENTGTASAINVRINDVLDSKLDEASIKMINASHPYVLDRLDNNLNWRFENIQLPPSVANTNTGKGYVMFKVKPKAGYAIGDIIPNSAAIYFDFNPAIVTNTFYTEFVQQLGITEFENTDFVFYPNPASANVTVSLKNDGSIKNVAVYDMTGKLILSQNPVTPLSSQTVDLAAISKGIYLLEVTTDTNVKAVKKLLIE